jgi:hypothetical protein
LLGTSSGIHRNNDGASSPRAIDIGGAWVHAPPHAEPAKWVDLECILFLFPSSPAVTPTVTCKRRKKHKPVDFNSKDHVWQNIKMRLIKLF